jgi:hypothetical protein
VAEAPRSNRPSPRTPAAVEAELRRRVQGELAQARSEAENGQIDDATLAAIIARAVAAALQWHLEAPEHTRNATLSSRTWRPAGGPRGGAAPRERDREFDARRPSRDFDRPPRKFDRPPREDFDRPARDFDRPRRDDFDRPARDFDRPRRDDFDRPARDFDRPARDDFDRPPRDRDVDGQPRDFDRPPRNRDFPQPPRGRDLDRRPRKGGKPPFRGGGFKRGPRRPPRPR